MPLDRLQLKTYAFSIATLTTTPSTPAPTKDTVTSPVVPQPINGIINTNAGFYMLPGGSDHVSVDRTETLPKTQKKNGAKKIGAYNCKLRGADVQDKLEL